MEHASAAGCGGSDLVDPAVPDHPGRLIFSYG
jgi:hypothetical protein